MENTVILNNGVQMPKIGYGVYQIPYIMTERCVTDALNVGYRSVDTAQCYCNEKQVGKAVKKSGLSRNEIFITTKLWGGRGYADTVRSIDSSLKALGMDYIDLLLIHEPTGDYLEIYRAMEDTIFFLIAGTYTPLTLAILKGAIGWVLFGVVWGAAIFGIVLNSIDLEKFRKPSVVCYILMGWVIIFAIKPMLTAMPRISLIFLLVGGVFYTVGIIFYALKKVKWFHSVWHIFTVAGSVFHYFSILIALTSSN